MSPPFSPTLKTHTIKNPDETTRLLSKYLFSPKKLGAHCTHTYTRVRRLVSLLACFQGPTTHAAMQPAAHPCSPRRRRSGAIAQEIASRAARYGLRAALRSCAVAPREFFFPVNRVVEFELPFRLYLQGTRDNEE